MFWAWLAGALFTDGFLDPHSDQGFWRGIYRVFMWPVELGKALSKSKGGSE